MDDVLHDSADVAMALGVIEGAELGGSLVQAGVGRYFPKLLEISKRIFHLMPRYLGRQLLTEDGATAFSLVANNSTHGDSTSLAAMLRVAAKRIDVSAGPPAAREVGNFT